TLLLNLLIALLPALVFAAAMALTYEIVTEPEPVQDSGLVEMGSFSQFDSTEFSGGLAEPEGATSLAEPAGAQTLGADATPADATATDAAAEDPNARLDAPAGFWITLAIGTVLLLMLYAIMTFARLEIFKM